MPPTESDQKTVNLLWTGGWDSTFQLLRLLLVERCRVAPFYLIDVDRRSTTIEIRTMRRIRDRLFADDPSTRELLRSTRYAAVVDVAPDAEITAAYRAICAKKHLGSQYDWLARFCKESAITDMQLCLTRHSVIETVVSDRTKDSPVVVRIDPTLCSPDEYILFRHYTFPTVNLTKKDMAAAAKEQGWDPIMAMTWFCHSPRRGGKPCGICRPCAITIDEGLGWRIPLSSRMVYWLYRSLLRPSKRLAMSILTRHGSFGCVRESAERAGGRATLRPGG